MRPCLFIDISANACLANTKQFCDFILRSACFVNGDNILNIIFREFGLRIKFTLRVIHDIGQFCMMGIFFICNPFKIGNMVIMLYGIFVIYAWLILRIFNKCKSNNTVNKKSFPCLVFTKPDAFVIVAPIWSKYFVRASNPAKITYLIKTFITNNCAPFFHNHSPIDDTRVKEHGNHHGKWGSGASLATRCYYNMQRNSANILAGGAAGAVGLNQLAELMNQEQYQ